MKKDNNSIWIYKNRRKYLRAGSWDWYEGTPDESERTNFDIECSVCGHKHKFSTRNDAIAYAATHKVCPSCKVPMADSYGSSLDLT